MNTGKKKVRIWWPVLGLISILAPAALGQAVSGSVTGVLEIGGEAVAGARIVVSCSADSAFEVLTQTDSEGRFSADGVPLGQVSVRAFNGRDELLAEGSGELGEAGASAEVELIPIP